MTDVAIINSGGANIASLRFALERLGVDCLLTADGGALRSARRVILPGVGAAGDAMQRLESLGIIDTIRSLGQPVLGICLGMQLLFETSEEGPADCLGVIPGGAQRLPDRDGYPVPHMGWNQLDFAGPDPLLRGMRPGDYMYFVHSYAVPVGPWMIATADYGGPFSAIVRRANFTGVQFHPERSGAAGARLLRNFLELA